MSGHLDLFSPEGQIRLKSLCADASNYLKEKPLDRISFSQKLLYLIPVFGWIKYYFDKYESNKCRIQALIMAEGGHYHAAVQKAHPLDKWRFELLEGVAGLGSINFGNKSVKNSHKIQTILQALTRAQKSQPEVKEITFFKAFTEEHMGDCAAAYQDYNKACRTGFIDWKTFSLINDLCESMVDELTAKHGASIEPNKKIALKDLKKEAAELEILINHRKLNVKHNPSPNHIAKLKKTYLEIAHQLHENLALQKQPKNKISLDNDPKEWMRKFEKLYNQFDSPHKRFSDAHILLKCYSNPNDFKNKNSPFTWMLGILANEKKSDLDIEKYKQHTSIQHADFLFQYSRQTGMESKNGYEDALRIYEWHITENSEHLDNQETSHIYEQLTQFYKQLDNKGGYKKEGSELKIQFKINPHKYNIDALNKAIAYWTQLKDKANQSEKTQIKQNIFICYRVKVAYYSKQFALSHQNSDIKACHNALMEAEKYGVLSSQEHILLENL